MWHSTATGNGEGGERGVAVSDARLDTRVNPFGQPKLNFHCGKTHNPPPENILQILHLFAIKPLDKDK